VKGYIRQRSKRSWEITIDVGRDPTTGKRRRHYESLRGSKKEAQLRLAELLVNINQGVYIKHPKRLSVSDWLHQWLESHVANILSQKAVESYTQELCRYVIPSLGGIRLNDLRPHHVQNYVVWALLKGRKRGGGLSHRTVQYHYRILSKALDDAMRMGLTVVNPCKAVTPPRAARRDIPSIGPDEFTRLISAIEQSSYYLYYYTLLLTGIRRGEGLALKWKDTDLELASIYIAHSLHMLDDGTIIIKEPKTSRSRRQVDLPVSLITLLRQHRNDQEVQGFMIGKPLTEDDFVFSNADRSPLNPHTVTHAFAKMASKAGIPHLRLHDLRHIHATMLLKAGVHPRIVQERLGHSSIATTLDIYTHTVPGLQKAAAERIDALLLNLKPEQNVGNLSA
jgi:integrase